MKNIFVVFLLILLSVPSCKTVKKAADVVAPAEDTIMESSFRKPIRNKELYAATTDMVPFDTVYILRDTLHLLTKNMTGCDEENFKLIWNGAMLKSLPPQTSVKLFHQVDADCKEQHHFHLTYNIASVRFKNDTATANGDSLWSKVTILRVGGWKNILKYER